MRALLVILGVIALLIGVAAQPANAGPGTDFDRFLKQAQKFAKQDDTQSLDPKPKGLCVCQNGGANHTRVGVLAHVGEFGDPYIRIRCYVRHFKPDGGIDYAVSCDTFEVLSK